MKTNWKKWTGIFFLLISIFADNVPLAMASVFLIWIAMVEGEK